MINEKQTLLLNESALAASSLGQGLTLLRKGNFTMQGYTSSAFFHLTIGLERLMKIILICDYFQRNTRKYPSNEYLKSQGHHINKLFKKCLLTSESHKKQELYNELKSDSIYSQIIDLFTEFANHGYSAPYAPTFRSKSIDLRRQ